MDKIDKNQDEEKENTNKQWIGDIAKENNKEKNEEKNNDNTKEKIKSYKDKNNNITKSKSTNNIKEINIINKPNLNYDYGDSIDSIYFNEITNSNIKYSINATNKKINEVNMIISPIKKILIQLVQNLIIIYIMNSKRNIKIITKLKH